MLIFTFKRKMADQSNVMELNIASVNLDLMPSKSVSDSKSRDELELQKMSRSSSNSDSNTRNDDKEAENNSKDDIVIIETMEQESTPPDVRNCSFSHESEDDESIEGK